MHIEFIVEDSSGRDLLQILVAKLLGDHGNPHTWRIHGYKGIGRLPKGGLRPHSDPEKRILLDQLPRILRGLGRTPGVDAIIVVLDVDRRDCKSFLDELNVVAERCGVRHITKFRLAIEEIESWYLGDEEALCSTYPNARRNVIHSYIQDSICGTWEILADAVIYGGRDLAKRQGGPHAGEYKHEWARRIGPRLDVNRNVSRSFQGFCKCIQKLVAA